MRRELEVLGFLPLLAVQVVILGEGAHVPAINSIALNSGTAGESGVMLTVTGENFFGKSSAQWNGSGRAAPFISSTQLQASISSSDIASAGTTQVPVYRSGRWNGQSAASTFTFSVSSLANITTGSRGSTGSTTASALTITTTSAPSGVVGVAHPATLPPTGPTPAYSCRTVARWGTLSPGPVLSASSTISAIPTRSGTYPLADRITDSIPQTATQDYTLEARTPTAISCTTSGSIMTISGNRTKPFDTRKKPLHAYTKVDATTAQWIGVSAYPINWAGGPGMCWTGGYVQNDPTIYTDSTPWSIWSTSAAFISYGVNQTIENLRLDHVGDAINIQLQNGAQTYFTVRGVYVSEAHDDCLENNWLQGGLTDDSLFDGCYEAFSARPAKRDVGGIDGRNNIWTIQNSLVRLQDMIGVASGPSPGNAGFFKWDFSSYNSGPKLKLYNNVFRLDLASFIGQEYAPLPDKLLDCSNNTVVWLGSGDYPVPLPRCFTLTRDKSVWDNAVANWKAKHGY